MEGRTVSAHVKSAAISQILRFLLAVMCIALTAGVCGTADPSRASTAFVMAAKHVPPHSTQITLIAGSAQQGSPHNPVKLHDRLEATAYSADGKWLAYSARDGTFGLYDLQGTGHRTFDIGKHRISALTFSADSKMLVSGGTDGSIRFWSLDGTELRKLEEHYGSVGTVSLSPDSRWVVSTGSDNRTRVWDLTTNTQTPPAGLRNRARWAAFLPDGRWVTRIGSQLHLSGPDGTETVDLQDVQGRLWRQAISPDGTMIAITGAGKLGLWRLDGTKLRLFEGIPVDGGMVAFSHDGKRIAASHGYTDVVTLLDANGTRLATFNGHGSSIRSIGFSPHDDRILIVDSKGRLTLWDGSPGTRVSYMNSIEPARSVAHSPDGSMIAVGGQDGKISLWDARGFQNGMISGHTGPVTTVAFSPDSQMIGTAGEDGAIKLWDLAGKQIAATNSDNRQVSSLAFSPDGNAILSGGSDGTVRRWHPHIGEHAEFGVHERPVTSDAFSP